MTREPSSRLWAAATLPRPRALALGIESAAQVVFRHAARHWTELRASRLPTHDARYFAGRACHCPPGLATHYVHSEGLRERCDFVVDYGANTQHPARKHVPVAQLRTAVASLGAGASVHVRTNNLADFVTHLLPALRAPIVLVTGDSDRSPVQAFEHLLSDARIAHWFVQNCDVAYAHPRLTRLPIGLDNPVFNKLEKQLGFLMTVALGKTPLDFSISKNDMGDQAALERVLRAGMPHTSARAARALCTFHQNQKLVSPDLSTLPARAEALGELRDNPACHFVPTRLRQDACWRLHAAHAFEVSPHGNGLDCFRTWECLALGGIPIVKTSALDRLYRDEGFPVVIVESYAQVTEASLRSWQHQLAGAFGPELRRKLSNDYWLAKIRAAQRAATMAR